MHIITTLGQRPTLILSHVIILIYFQNNDNKYDTYIHKKGCPKSQKQGCLKTKFKCKLK